MFDPTGQMPRPNRSLIYFGACIIAGLRLAREKQVTLAFGPPAIAQDADFAPSNFQLLYSAAESREVDWNWRDF